MKSETAIGYITEASPCTAPEALRALCAPPDSALYRSSDARPVQADRLVRLGIRGQRSP